eukprot:879685-Rhodomonas_salina.1
MQGASTQARSAPSRPDSTSWGVRDVLGRDETETRLVTKTKISQPQSGFKRRYKSSKLRFWAARSRAPRSPSLAFVI